MLLSAWNRLLHTMGQGWREVRLSLLLLAAAAALFYLAFNLANASLPVLLAGGVVFGCLVALFGFARARPAVSAEKQAIKTALLTPTVLINEVRAAALVTYAHIGTVTVKKERAMPDWRALGRLFGEELVMDVGVRVIAGVNLKRLRDKDVSVSGKAVSINLPPTKVLMVYVDESLTRVIAHRTGWLTGQDLSMMDSARREAMEGMVNATIENDLLMKAGQQAATAVAAIARGLGFDDIKVTPTMPVNGQHFEELQDSTSIAKIVTLPPSNTPRDDQAGD